MKIFTRGNKLNLLIVVAISVLFTLFSLSCRKEESITVEPEIILISPSNGTIFNVFDTILIKASVHHSKKILKTTLSITDKDLKRIEGGASLNPDTSAFEIDTRIVIENRYIRETENYLLIEIEDDNQVFNFWYDLKINPLEKELQNLLIVTQLADSSEVLNQPVLSTNNADIKRLYKVSTDGSYTKLNEWFSEYLGGFADSRFRLFYSSGSINAGISAFDLAEDETKWIVPAQTTGSIPYFTCFDGIEGEVSVGLYDGSAECYDQNGLILMKTAKYEGGRFISVKNFDKWVAGIFNPFNGPNAKLYIFNNPAGNQYDMLNLPGSSAMLIPFDSNSLLVIVDETGTQEAYTYNFTEKQLNYLHRVTTDRLLKSTGSGNDIFFVSENDIKWYKPGIGSTVNYLPIGSANSIAFDPGSNSLFVGKDNILYTYNLPLTTPSSTIEFPEEIREINLLYNK